MRTTLKTPTGTDRRAGDGGDDWYYRVQDGGHDLVRGPFSRAELRTLCSRGHVPPRAMVRNGLRGDWQLAGTYFPSFVKTRMRPSLGHIVLPVLFVVLLVALYARDSRNGPYPRVLPFGKTATPDKFVFLSLKPMEPFRAPNPLPTEKPPEPLLTKQRVIMWTNEARVQEMLPPLAENKQLDMVAEERVNDMFRRQYFAHVAPSGEDVSEGVRKIGYQYRLLSENIAKGAFRDEQRVVQGWLHSEGHRKNMLSQDVEEIGVGVGKGSLNGEIVWIAVQVFGKSLPPAADKAATERTAKSSQAVCVKPNETLRSGIDALRAEVSLIGKAAAGLKTEIETDRNGLLSKSRTKQEYDENLLQQYAARIRKYNLLVGEMKRKDQLAREMVAEYNSEVDGYNGCIRD